MDDLNTIKQAIETAMIGLGNHASRDTALGRAIDGAWNALEDILTSIQDHHYNDDGEFIG